MDIEDWRGKIDEIDQQILELLNERARCSIEIGNLKQERHLPIHSPDREKAIVCRLVDQNGGPLSGEGVRRVFERIIDESRRLEKDELKKLKPTKSNI